MSVRDNHAAISSAQSSSNADAALATGSTSPADVAPYPPDGSASANTHPYWIPLGLDIAGWPPHIRAHVAAVINPEYEELVLKAKPGVGRQMAISLLHLGWLEILDHLRLGKLIPPPDDSDPLEVLGIEPRQAVIARHLRLVNSKLRIAQFLLRLDEFKANYRPQSEAGLNSDDQLHSAIRDADPNSLLQYVIKNGKDDVC